MSASVGNILELKLAVRPLKMEQPGGRQAVPAEDAKQAWPSSRADMQDTSVSPHLRVSDFVKWPWRSLCLVLYDLICEP